MTKNNEAEKEGASVGVVLERLVRWVWFAFGTIYLLPLAIIFSIGKKYNIRESARLLRILTLWKHDAFALPHQHKWREYKMVTKKYIYYCRECSCGIKQRKRAGGTGDGTWHSFDSPFRWNWEQEDFKKAVRI